MKTYLGLDLCLHFKSRLHKKLLLLSFQQTTIQEILFANNEILQIFNCEKISYYKKEKLCGLPTFWLKKSPQKVELIVKNVLSIYKNEVLLKLFALLCDYSQLDKTELYFANHKTMFITIEIKSYIESIIQLTFYIYVLHWTGLEPVHFCGKK